MAVEPSWPPRVPDSALWAGTSIALPLILMLNWLLRKRMSLRYTVHSHARMILLQQRGAITDISGSVAGYSKTYVASACCSMPLAAFERDTLQLQPKSPGIES